MVSLWMFHKQFIDFYALVFNRRQLNKLSSMYNICKLTYRLNIVNLWSVFCQFIYIRLKHLLTASITHNEVKYIGLCCAYIYIKTHLWML